MLGIIEFIICAILAVGLVALLFILLKKIDARRGVDQKGRANIPFDKNKSFEIAEIERHGMTALNCGRFHGYVLHEKDNALNGNAVAVYKGTSNLIGYLSRDIGESVVARLDSEGGKVPCFIEILREFDNEARRWYLVGRVQIIWPDE